MRAWTCRDFPGFYPVGTGAVVVAWTEEEARELLKEKLHTDHSLDVPDEDFTLQPLDLTRPGVVVLNDGNY